MGEPEAKGEIASALEENEPNKGRNPVLSRVSNFVQSFNFAPWKSETPRVGTAVSRTESTSEIVVDASEENESVTVKFSDARPVISPLKLEAEMVHRDTDPVVLWQEKRQTQKVSGVCKFLTLVTFVYAIGGFFILRWVLARWKERREKTKPANKDADPPAQPGYD